MFLAVLESPIASRLWHSLKSGWRISFSCLESMAIGSRGCVLMAEYVAGGGDVFSQDRSRLQFNAAPLT